MKAEHEQKKTTSIRLSDDEKKIVKEKAAAKGMQFASYIEFMALHGVEGISPETLVKIQNILNGAVEAVIHMDKSKVLELKQEANELWQSLK